MYIADIDKILIDMCNGRNELLMLGRQFNQDVINKCGEYNHEHTKNNNAVFAIFELEGIGLSDKEKVLFGQMDLLNWSDDKIIRFLKIY